MTLPLSSSHKVLHAKALALSRSHRLVENQLIEILIEIDSTRLFRTLGFSSLFIYAVRSLGFSEATAYAMIAVARKAKEISQLRVALKEEKLSVARASRITSVLTTENAITLIAFAAHHSARETDREVARIAGNGGNEKRRALLVSEEVLDLLKRAQSLLASRNKKHIAAQEALKLVFEDYLERHDPVKKAERTANRKTKSEPLSSERSEFLRNRRKPFSASERHAVFRRDGGLCAFVDVSGQMRNSDQGARPNRFHSARSFRFDGARVNRINPPGPQPNC